MDLWDRFLNFIRITMSKKESIIGVKIIKNQRGLFSSMGGISHNYYRGSF